MLTVMNAAPESLKPLIDHQAPQSFAELWNGYDPRADPLEVEVLQEWEEEGVVLQIVRYQIGIFKGERAMMAGVYGYPKGGEELPALLNIHGGGQFADYRAVMTNAQRGYATLTIAWAGRIAAPGHRVGPDEVKLFFSGKIEDPSYKLTTDWGALDAYHAPTRHPESDFAKTEPQSWTLDAVDSPRNNSWFLVTLAARRGLTFLEQQPVVDPERLGVYGHSMGGKLTVATAAADQRVKVAAPSCGGISDFATGNALYDATLELNTIDGVPRLSMKVDRSKEIVSVDVYYTQQGQVDGLKDRRDNTVNRFWHHVTPEQQEISLVAELPLLSIDEPLWVYANVEYRLLSKQVGSSYYYREYTAESVNLSSLVQMVSADELRDAGVNPTLKPTLDIEDFEGDWQKEWFSYNPEKWGRLTHKVYDPQWIAPADANLVFEVATAEANTLVVGIDDYAVEVPLDGGYAREVITLSAIDFKNAVGESMSSFAGIKELRLLESDRLRVDKQTVNYGGKWKGSDPIFANMHWESTLLS